MFVFLCIFVSLLFLVGLFIFLGVGLLLGFLFDVNGVLCWGVLGVFIVLFLVYDYLLVCLLLCLVSDVL